jgi:hypothetical protein
VVAGLALAACAAGDHGRDCEPVRDQGCHGGEHCVVDAEGVPRCVEPGIVETGDVCASWDDCRDPGVGCVDLYGVARCLPFCGPDLADPDARCAWGEPKPALGRCQALLPDRPDIGVCVYHCNPALPLFTPGDPALDAASRLDLCPSTATCALPVDLDHAVCSGDVGPAGDEPRPCGPDAPCPAGRLCAPYGAGARCRAVPDHESRACTDSDERPVALTDDPGQSEDDQLKVCLPCRVLARDAADRSFSLCYALESREAAAARCAREGGTAATRADLGDDRLDAVLQLAPADGLGGPAWLGTDDCAGTCADAAHALCVIPP